MDNLQQLNMDAVKAVLQSSSIEELTMREIYDFFQKEDSLSNYKPESVFQIDPRNGELIVYNSSRATRPHRSDPEPKQALPENACPICNGKTTGIMDIAELSSGFTFINKNMFPIFFPFDDDPHNRMGSVSFGLHFLQWTSSIHTHDWHNMPVKDLKIVMQRLAALERKLLLESGNLMPTSEFSSEEKPTYGYVSIIKNYGKIAGGSLAHGHQQIVASNIMPKQFYNNWNFYVSHKLNFTNFLLNENPEDLLVKDYGPAVLLVPYFMRRPYDIFLVLKDTSKKFLYELSDEELSAVTVAWQETVRVLLQLLHNFGKEEAYNVTVNNGPGAGLYLEFLPFTQLIGGYEKIGLWVCQESPFKAAETIREYFQNLTPRG